MGLEKINFEGSIRRLLHLPRAGQISARRAQTLRYKPPQLSRPARDLLSKIGSVEFRISRLDGLIRPNGRSRVLTPESYLWINKVVSEGAQRHEPVSMAYLSEQIQLMFQVDVSLNTPSQIIRQIPSVKVIHGIPMEKARVFPDSRAMDAY
jgi:hypothetical protein